MSIRQEGNNKMSEGTEHLALFKEIDPATIAIDKLRQLGIEEKDITIISGAPYSEKMLGRPMSWTRIPQIAGAGFVLGLVVSLLLNWGTPLQYPIHVGGLPLLAIPTTLVLTFEIAMLGLLAFTFLGVIWESAFPSFGPKVYRPEVSDGRIAVVFYCPPELHAQAHEALAALGAEWVHRTEATEI
jgi:Alternative complex III, ActD subunit